MEGKRVTRGNTERSGFVERNNRAEFIQNDKITVKMSWLFFAKTLESLCDTLKV